MAAQNFQNLMLLFRAFCFATAVVVAPSSSFVVPFFLPLLLFLFFQAVMKRMKREKETRSVRRPLSGYNLPLLNTRKRSVVSKGGGLLLVDWCYGRSETRDRQHTFISICSSKRLRHERKNDEKRVSPLPVDWRNGNNISSVPVLHDFSLLPPAGPEERENNPEE